MTITRIFATDPVHGDEVSIPELAKRHDFEVSTLRRRYADGLRGHELIKPARHIKKKAAKPSSGLKAAKPLTRAEQEAVINQARSSRSGMLSCTLLKDYGKRHE